MNMFRGTKRIWLAGFAIVALALAVNAWASSGSGLTAHRRSPPAGGGGTPSRSRSVADARRSAAIASVDRILSAAVMPTGSVRASTAPAGAAELRSLPPIRLFLQAQVDRRSLWTTSAAASSVFASIRSHLPAGSKIGGSAGSGEAARPGQLTTDWFELPTVEPRALGIRQLVVDAVLLPNGKTAVRIDAEVQYLAPRTTSQAIPAAAQVLQISKRPAGSHSSRLVRTIAQPATVRRIAADVDALPFGGNWQGTGFSCPAMGDNIPYDTFTFRATVTGPALATFGEVADTPTTVDPCGDATLKVGGRTEPAIEEGAKLLSEVDHLLNIHLTVKEAVFARR
jgi:hypothetical protein